MPQQHSPAPPDELAPFTNSDELRSYIDRTSNWGRWGADDQRGAVNLITAETRVRAAALVRDGITVSLSRPMATTPDAENPWPVHHFMQGFPRGDGSGAAHDYFSISCHGATNTHIDALSHVWGEDGRLYNGAKADTAIGFDRAAWGGIQHWRDGIFTRGVLLDVPGFRREPYVRTDQPVTAAELDLIARESGVPMASGDAAIVYCGRDRWDQDNPAWGSLRHDRPGLDVSCIKFLRRYDCSVLVWDMLEQRPADHGMSWGVHLAIPAYGVVLIDNASLGELVTACSKLDRNEFLLTINPLYLDGGTGAPTNPVAVF